ncbi:Molybdopterin synthase catalytic subunit [Lobulomyces angularis]|nr:Molybdopterin synthase catalytic subunit [Lobulomyces angularis]
MLDEVELMKYHNDFVDITDENLNLSVLIDKVRTEDSGAICTFSGTTRNYFVVDGIKRKVVSLEYESYTPMAIKEMQKTVKLARTKFQDINKIAVQHKIGKCLVGEESVCIAMSLKGRVPFGKKRSMKTVHLTGKKIVNVAI